MIRKRQRYDSGQYAILPRSVINNAGLSFDARGLLIYLLEKPADWTVSNEELYRASPAGERHINTLLTELKAHGYVHREKVYDPPTRTFRWDTTVYDFPEDNPHYQGVRMDTKRMDTKRMDTKRMDTKRSDDLILDLPIENINTPAPRDDETPQPPPRTAAIATPPARQLSELERQGYPAEPPTVANRYPARPRLMPFTPLSLKAMELTEADLRRLAAEPADGLYAPAKFHQGERGVPLTREESMRLWMLAMLGVVCGVQLRTGQDESAADALWPPACDLAAEGITPPRLWVAFGDPSGYWWASEEHAWKRRRPTAAEVLTYWGAALEWRPATQREKTPSGERPSAEVLARAETAWNELLRGVRRFSEYRNDDLMASLDEVTRAALGAFGGIRRIRTMNVDRDSASFKRQFIGEYQSAVTRLAGEPGGEASPAPAMTREPRPQYAAA